MKRFTQTIFFVLTLGINMSLSAQPEYTMSNRIVDDCEGFLLDSELGGFPGTYDHNENYTFSICIPGSDEITLDFYSFCLEPDFDSLRVFDGPDTLSTLLGTFKGEEDPPRLIARSGCMTVNFISDPNVACHGWLAYWQTEFDRPEPPDILPIDNLPCFNNSLTLTFDEAIPCDSLYPGAFAISGPQSPTISSVTPLDCSGGTATTVRLNYDPPLDFSGVYQIEFTRIIGICETPYVLRAMEDFFVVGCPLNVEILMEEDLFCAGDSIEIFAEASGGDPSSYVFSWLPIDSTTSGPSINIAPDSSLWVKVLVMDGSGASASDSIFIEPIPLPVLSLMDTTLCESVDTFTFTAIPMGGTWSGQGFEEDSGSFYDIDLIDGAQDTITYTDENGCTTEIALTIIPLDEGTDDAACPGADPFLVSGGFPEGGSWSGPFIDTSGLFTPPDSIGSYEVTYSHPNGCVGQKMINIDDIELPPLDSICQSELPFEIEITPFGGIWEGPGIIDPDFGEFDPKLANIGDNKLIYIAEGCRDTLNLFVKEISAGEDLVVCPVQEPFSFENWQPIGGIWRGEGIIDTLSALYDPGTIPSGFIDTVRLYANGCIDYRTIWVIQTDIPREDTILFCLGDDPIDLNPEATGVVPENGVWSGPGTNQVDINLWQFAPSLADTGLQKIYYETNTCIDSLYIDVRSTPVVTPVSICAEDDPVLLDASPPAGIWRGSGIMDESTGLFDPQEAGIGIHPIIFQADNGCRAELEAEVFNFIDASLGEVDPTYCFTNSIIEINPSPEGGSLFIDSLPAANFNPAEVGPGLHRIEYIAGQGGCADTVFTMVEVEDSISLNIPFDIDTICFGQGLNLSVSASGGSNGQLNYNWNQGLESRPNHYISPEKTLIYSVTVSDDCSDPKTADMTVFVHRAINTDIMLGPKVCFDDTTFASISAFPGDDYTYIWDTDPPTFGNSIVSYPTAFDVEVIDNETGCSIEEYVDLPGWPLLTANFGISPNQGCISALSGEIDLLDFSVGGETGYWDFGDGTTTTPYLFGQNLSHLYVDTGTYTILLHLENEGGCISEFEVEACVEAEHRIYAPNAFTPNGDGKNEFFRIVGAGIEEIDWYIYNRYGEMIYQGASMEDSWDGKYKGNFVPPGVYAYLAEYTTIHGQKDVLKGLITVIY